MASKSFNPNWRVIMIKLATAFAVSALVLSAGTFTGVITESMCVNDHKAMKIGSDPECIKACAKLDSKVKYVLFDGKTSYKLSDQETPRRFAAQKVRITGTLYEKTGVIKVDKIESLNSGDCCTDADENTWRPPRWLL